MKFLEEGEVLDGDVLAAGDDVILKGDWTEIV